MQAEEFFRRAADGERDFSGWTLENASLTRGVASSVGAGSGLAESNFRQAVLSGATLEQLDLTGSDFAGAILTGAHLQEVNLTKASFVGGDLQKAYIGSKDRSILEETNFDGANLSGATVFNVARGVSFREAQMSELRLFVDYGVGREELRDLDFTGAVLTQAQFCGNFEGCRFVDIQGAGVDFGSCRLKACDFTDALLHKAILGGRGERVDLSEASFRGADLREVDLSGRVLRGVDFREADLTFVTFVQSDLTGANLEGAKLGSNQWLGAQLEDTQFSSEAARSLRMRLAGYAPSENPTP
jgi:uncharacterized protein YjbI with pentapeptide repeats